MLEIDTGLNGHLFSQKKIFVFPVALVLNTNTPKKKERAEGDEREGGRDTRGKKGEERGRERERVRKRERESEKERERERER